VSEIVEGRFEVLQHADGLLTRYGREILQKLIERHADLEVVQKSRDGHPCPHENRRPPEYLRVDIYRHVLIDHHRASDYNVKPVFCCLN